MYNSLLINFPNQLCLFWYSFGAIDYVADCFICLSTQPTIIIIITLFNYFSINIYDFNTAEVMWPWKGSLMKTQTWILDNRLYYPRKIELHRKGKKYHTVRITLILICPLASKSLVLITVKRVHYGKMGKVPSTWGLYGLDSSSYLQSLPVSFPGICLKQ